MRPVIRAYRQLLCAQRDLFAKDLSGRTAARVETRIRFLEHADAPPEQVDALVTDALDACGFIRQNVAQTILNEKGNYGARAATPTGDSGALPSTARLSTCAQSCRSRRTTSRRARAPRRSRAASQRSTYDL